MQASTKDAQILNERISKHGWIDLPADGTSMYPLIKKGDICRFVSHETSNSKKGDILLFWTSEGKLVAHRIVRFYTQNNQKMFLFKGDTNLGMDKPITEEQIIGKLIFIKGKKRKVNVSNPILHAWGKAILLFPLLSALLRSFLNKTERELM